MEFDLEGHLAETNQKVGDLPLAHQVILIQPLDATNDLLVLCESRGRKACVHLSEVEVTNIKFEV